MKFGETYSFNLREINSFNLSIELFGYIHQNFKNFHTPIISLQGLYSKGIIKDFFTKIYLIGCLSQPVCNSKKHETI